VIRITLITIVPNSLIFHQPVVISLISWMGAFMLDKRAKPASIEHGIGGGLGYGHTTNAMIAI